MVQAAQDLEGHAFDLFERRLGPSLRGRSVLARQRLGRGMGFGDVKMLAMIGAFLGWKAVLVTLVLASFAGALIGVLLMAAERGNMKFALPFGTFLALGAVVAMFVGDPLVAWYAGFF